MRPNSCVSIVLMNHDSGSTASWPLIISLSTRSPVGYIYLSFGTLFPLSFRFALLVGLFLSFLKRDTIDPFFDTSFASFSNMQFSAVSLILVALASTAIATPPQCVK